MSLFGFTLRRQSKQRPKPRGSHQDQKQNSRVQQRVGSKLVPWLLAGLGDSESHMRQNNHQDHGRRMFYGKKPQIRGFHNHRKILEGSKRTQEEV
jgi:hypothetical protein